MNKYIQALAILRTIFGTILKALEGKYHRKVELNASQGVEVTLI